MLDLVIGRNGESCYFRTSRPLDRFWQRGSTLSPALDRNRPTPGHPQHGIVYGYYPILTMWSPKVSLPTLLLPYAYSGA